MQIYFFVCTHKFSITTLSLNNLADIYFTIVVG